MPRILFLDAYDSFASNIVALLISSTGADVEVIKIDDVRFGDPDIFQAFVQQFDAVVAGPGPGTPENPADIGLIAHLWHVNPPVPVLGICLGFQSLAVAHGARIKRLNEPRHGVITKVIQKSMDGKGVSVIETTQYHSLHVDIGHEIQKSGLIDDPASLWIRSPECPFLLPLAWDLNDADNGMILMSAKHCHLPFWGVQYHPESICTSKEGAEIIADWWRSVMTLRKRRMSSNLLNTDSRLSLSKSNIGNDNKRQSTHKVLSHILEDQRATSAVDISRAVETIKTHQQQQDTVQWSAIPSQNLEVDDIVSLFGMDKGEAIILETPLATRSAAQTKTGYSHSIIACFNPDEDIKIQYYINSKRVELLVGEKMIYSVNVGDVWTWLRGLMSALQCDGGSLSVPFWGGLMGYVSYEAGLETIDVHAKLTKYRPDICFVYVTRSIVIDHQSRAVYAQSLRHADGPWISATMKKVSAVVLGTLVNSKITPKNTTKSQFNPVVTISPPATRYQQKVLACQELIRAGESYELCLTDQTELHTKRLANNEDYWQMYRHLRHLNPAPFATYLRLGRYGQSVTVLGSSPERFLSWTRQGVCQLRPIKGTVRKGPGVDLAAAKEILGSTKEMAENLMIVDLIRHDLHGVLGPGNVRVKQLMVVEEYKTVYQLVSVIEGDLTGASFGMDGRTTKEDSREHEPSNIPRSKARTKNKSKEGIEVLAASLPPGSMTGAPKKRSCELLQAIEDNKPRGIYSGVIGYLDVGGGGDFSVVIRTAVKWDDETRSGGDGEAQVVLDVWRVGAGGAVTARSTPEGEFEEMITKRESTVRLFANDS